MSDNNDNIEIIDAYFRNQLNDTEKLQFEKRCLTDNDFAIQVADFIASEEGIRQKVLQNKKKYWADNQAPEKINTTTIKQWMPYAAAACLVTAFILYFIFRPDTPHKLATNYISDHYNFLSQAMNASKDSIELGIAAYNNQEYDKALQFFQNYFAAHPTNSKSKKYTGLVYLRMKDYDKALQQFDEQASMKEAYSNDGLFLKAMVLLTRNKEADKTMARLLLEQVVKENAEGSATARKWLDAW